MTSEVVYYQTKDDDEEFIQVMEKEDGEVIEFPKEDDGNVLLRTIQTQFATAIGLKYKGPSGAWRAVKEGEDANLLAPKAGWGNRVYYLTFSGKEDNSRKRKGEGTFGSSNNDAKHLKPDALLRDLAVVGIPYEADHQSLKTYFNEKYGGVLHLMIKVDKMTGKSKGFGFIRFDNAESAQKALESEDDEFMGRKISVKPKTQKPLKMYVNSLPEGTTKEDLVEYFSKFGEIIDSYIPTPFRHYGFFTFASSEDGFACLNEEHTLKGRQINVRRRTEGGAQAGAQGGNAALGNAGGFGGGGFGSGFADGFATGLTSGTGGRGRGRGGRGGGAHGGGRVGFIGGGGSLASGVARGGDSQNPQMDAQLKNMLFQFLSQT